jgi:glycolate oxidase FAD binding subunit
MTDISRQLVDQIKAARADGYPLKIRGGGTKQHLCGRDITGKNLEVAGHKGIINYDPTELVITARAGTPLDELESVLSENDQIFSFEPPRFGEGATLGGTLACNQSGPSRPWAGSIRDMVLGARLINGNGDHLRFGGQVMKNVAGYDVTRLQAGALGCLGVLTEISIRVLPKAKTTLTLVREASESDAILEMSKLAGLPKPLNGAAWVDGQLYLRLSGEESALRETARVWGGEQVTEPGLFWTALREQQLEFFKSAVPLWRFSIRPTAGCLMPEATTVIDWAGAQRWLRGDYDFDKLQDIASQAGGHVTLFRGGDRSGEVRQALPEIQRQLQKRLKLSFDPKSILNPGRLYSWM